MILLIKFRGRCEKLCVEPTISLKTLEELSKELFGVEKETLCLSLNKQDPVGTSSATLRELGLVEKDCLHLVGTTAEQSDAASSGAMETKPSLAQLPSFRPINVLEESFAKAFREGMPKCVMQNEMEVLSALVYVAFIAQRFRNQDDSIGIPPDWKDLSCANFFKFQLKHPVTEKVIKVTCTTNVVAKVNATAFVQAQEISDPKAQVYSISIPLAEVPRELQKTMSEPVKVFLSKVYNSFVKKVYGSREPSYLSQLPQFPLLVISKHLSVRDFSSLTRTCKDLRRHWDVGLFWKQMFQRDFKGVQLDEQETSVNWKEKYMHHYLRNRQSRSPEARPIETGPNILGRPYPRATPIAPPDEYPGIGGPSDLYPALNVPFRTPDIFPDPSPGGLNIPPMRGRPPRGPRYDPPFPLDPDGRIRLPPPGSRRPRGDPHTYFPPFL